HGALAAEEDAAEVDGHDRVPVLLLRLEQRLRITTRDAGVVHHHVEPAAALYRRAHEPVEVVPARRVGLEELSAAAEQLVRGCPALPRFASHVADDDERPPARAADGGRAAEPR